ncbi:protein Spindly [Diorhabda sublineata]|uniref:protein Spindly n=1 Tax=Diorhabda sublineata TaxID=1163346 RepID=UPI0024E09BB4|nr:protein Spindly [Diorhabda sublineata]
MEQSVDNCESLKADNLTLKQELDSIKLELDKANQQLYECQRNVRVLTSVQAEYQNEIDMLQSEQIKQKQKYQDIIKQLEQNINNMRESYNDEKQTFENVIMKMEEKNELMKNELDVYKGSYDNNVTNFGDTSSLIQDILSDPPEFYENQQLKDTVKELQSKNEILTRQLEEYTNELENLKESLNCTRTDLHEANATNQFLNDEILCLKTELDNLKNQPLNKDSRGNSLFAEVDDRRVFLQDQVNKMKASYIAMVQEKAQLENTIHQLKLENMRQLEKWKSDIEEKDNDNHEVTVALKSRIEDLEKVIEKYKKELLQKPVVLSKKNFEEIEYYSLTLNEKNQEIQSLKDEMCAKSLDRFLLSTALREANDEKRKWRLKAMDKEHQLELLKMEIANNLKEKTKNDDSEESLQKASHKTNKKDYKNNMVDKDSSKVETLSPKRLSDIKEEYENPLQDNSNFKIENKAKSRFTIVLEEHLSGSLEVEQKPDECDKSRVSMLKKDESKTTEKENAGGNKENIIESKIDTNQTKKVSFAENTVSPKKTQQKGGRRIVAIKNINFKK